MFAKRAHATHRTVLQHAQELCLHRRRHFADLVDEQCRIVGDFKQSRLGRRGAGKGSFFVAEQFAFQEVFRHGGTVDNDQGPICAAAFLMDGPCRQFLARAAFTLNQNGFITRSDPVDQPKNAPHCVRLPEDDGIRLTPLEHGLELAVLLGEPRSLPGLFNENLEFSQRKRLRQIIVGAELHRLDGRIDRPLGRQQDDLDVAPFRDKPIQHFDAGHARHHHVQKRDVEIAFIEQFQRFDTTLSLLHVAAAAAEPPRNGPPKVGVVIGNQQVDSRRLVFGTFVQLETSILRGR